MKKVWLALMVLAGCAAPQKKMTKKEFLSGDSTSVPLSEVKSNLTRSHGPMLAYNAEATLITSSLIDAQERETGKKAKDSATEIQKRVQSRLATEVSGKTCFDIVLTVPMPDALGVSDPGSFSHWRAKAKGKADADFQELTFQSLGPSSRTRLSASQKAIEAAIVGSGATSEGRAKNSSRACSSRPLSMESPIELMLIPSFGDERFKNIEMSW